MKITITDNREAHSEAKNSSATHKHVQASTTLSRKYVHRPTPVVKPAPAKAQASPAKAPEAKVQTRKTTTTSQNSTPKSAAISRYASISVAEAAQIAQARPAVAPKTIPAEPKAEARKVIASTSTETPVAKKTTKKDTAKQAKLDLKRAKQTAKAEKKLTKKAKISKKERAIKSALRNIDSISDSNLSGVTAKKRRTSKIIIATACAATVIGLLGSYVYFNLPGVSVQMVSARTGIDATYPSYIPRGYSMETVYTARDGEITMKFSNSETKNYFTLTEEKSTWDSVALLNNYVKKNFREDYTTLRENGITIYNDGANTTWVNGGILFKIQTFGSSLTKEQIRNLVTSM